MSLFSRHPQSLSARGGHGWIGPALLAAFVLLVAAWFLPLMTISKLLFLSERISISGIVWGLFKEREVLVFLVVFVFSMLFPAVKLISAWLIWRRVDASSPRAHFYVGLLNNLGKWSMLDVFVVALTIVAVKVSIVNDVEVHAGIYVFTGAIVLSVAATHRMQKLLGAAQAEATSASAAAKPAG
ncbi:MAG: paraquat-inducible protein A [Alphaproteobacteria bacterium]